MNFVQNTPIFSKINIPNMQFRSCNIRQIPDNCPNDNFCTNPIYESYNDKNQILQTAKTNPKIMSILKEYNIPLHVNTKELESLQKGHLKDTRITAAKIYSSLPEELKKEVNLSKLQEAAMLHDYGKVLIPPNILNKKGKLTEKENEIMKLHSELGFELLKDKNLDEEVLKLIKYHHQTPNKDGYPTITDDYKPTVAAEILQTADKYSALREERCYKESLDKDEALKVIQEDVNSGMISQEVFNALKKSE